MKVILNNMWFKMNEYPAKNSDMPYLSCSVEATDEILPYIRSWYAENLNEKGNFKEEIDALKILPFAGHEFGVYTHCYVDSIAKSDKRVTFHIVFTKKNIQP